MLSLSTFRHLWQRWMLALLTCLALGGCIQIDGVHYVNAKGDSDGGGYVLSMNNLMYLSMLQDKPQVLDDLKKFSRPSISQRGENTYIADRSGTAMMDRFYDRVRCTPARAGWSDCTYSMRQDGWTFPAWSMDWKVVVPRHWVVLESNHDRRILSGDQQQLLWTFDGNRVNGFDITFTVRVPNS